MRANPWHPDRPANDVLPPSYITRRGEPGIFETIMAGGAVHSAMSVLCLVLIVAALSVAAGAAGGF